MACQHIPLIGEDEAVSPVITPFSASGSKSQMVAPQGEVRATVSVFLAFIKLKLPEFSRALHACSWELLVPCLPVLEGSLGFSACF